MKKKVKEAQYSISKNEPYKTVFEEYLDLFTFEKRPVTKEFKNMFFEKFLRWAREDEEALKPSQFWNKEGVFQKDVYKWRDSDEKYAHIYATILQILGNRRELLGLKRKMDPGMVMFTMPHYDKDWKELVEWRTKIKQENGEKSDKIEVYIDNFPQTPVVPPKKEKE